jgi:hypothetical protein
VNLKAQGLDLPLTVEHMQDKGWKKRLAEFAGKFSDAAEVYAESLPNTGEDQWRAVLNTPAMQQILAGVVEEETGVDVANPLKVDPNVILYGGAE